MLALGFDYNDYKQTGGRTAGETGEEETEPGVVITLRIRLFFEWDFWNQPNKCCHEASSQQRIVDSLSCAAERPSPSSASSSQTSVEGNPVVAKGFPHLAMPTSTLKSSLPKQAGLLSEVGPVHVYLQCVWA